MAMARWIRDEGKLPAPGGLLLLSPWCDPSRSFPHSTTSYVARPNPEDYLADAPAARRLLVTSLLGKKPHEFLTSPYISPASALGTHGCFNDLPPTFVHYGDAERLLDEIDALVSGMRRDGVELDVEKTPDAVHDVLMVRFWNEDVRGHIYERICGWLDRIVERSSTPTRSRAASSASAWQAPAGAPTASAWTSSSPASPRESAGGAGFRRTTPSSDSLAKGKAGGSSDGQAARTQVIPADEAGIDSIEEMP